MCGFGPRTGARTLAEIGDPNRFANPARLAAYAGLAPATGNQAAATAPEVTRRQPPSKTP